MQDFFWKRFETENKLSSRLFFDIMRNSITKLIEFFYPPFKRLMPLGTFRYAACGGANVALDICLFFIAYNFIFQKRIVDFGLIAFQPHIAAFLFSFLITFPVGFLLSKYVVWTGSTIRGHVQLFRYFLIVMMNLLFNYFFIKLFVEHFHIFPTIAKIMTTGIIIVFSYLSQKHYTFKVKAA
ncbi:MAG: phenylalanine 4-monooxygenase [Ferruginibacter sp.]|nr:phenylalanine 4-monooxygenase [Ferruginibacter sp.]